MLDIQLIDGLYHIRGPKCVLILTKAELIQALRRGKAVRRRQALQARMREAHNHGGQADRHTRK